MSEVPKIVKARLAVVKPAGAHPDADVLTAFAERALAEREREKILAHLAGCHECREVVALASPDDVVAAPEPARGGFRFPGLLGMTGMRWAALTACVLVIASVVFVNRSFSPSTDALNDVAPDQGTAPVAQPKPPVEQSKVQSEMRTQPQPAGSRAGVAGKTTTDQVASLQSAKTPAAKDGDFALRTRPANAPQSGVVGGAFSANNEKESRVGERDTTRREYVDSQSAAQQKFGYNPAKQQPGGGQKQETTALAKLEPGVAGAAANNSNMYTF